MSNPAGLYIGADFVDLIVLTSVKRKLKVLKSIRTFFYGEDSVPEKVDRQRVLPLAIKKTLSSARLGAPLVNFALPNNEVMIRNFTMPLLPEQERMSAVKFEARRYLPFRIEETVSDFCITEERKDTKSMDVLFVAVGKQAADKYMVLLTKELGIKLNVIDIAPLGLLRVLDYCGRLKGEQASVVVYLETNGCGSIIITKNKNVYLAREIGLVYASAPPNGGTLRHSAQATSQQVSAKPGAGSGSISASFFENILNTVRLSIDYYKRETKEADIGSLIICQGDGGSDLEQYLKKAVTDIPVIAFNLADEITGLNDLSRRQLIAIGLAMASLERTKNLKINLANVVAGGVLKGRMPKGRGGYKPFVVESAGLFLMLLILQALGSARLGLERGNLTKLKSEKSAILKGAVPDLSGAELLKMEVATTSQMGFLKALVGEKKFLLIRGLSSLGRVLPEQTWIESFEYTNEIDKTKTLNINGMIYSKEGPSIANKILSDIKDLTEFSLEFEGIGLDSMEMVSAYDKDILAFKVKCTGQPLKSAGMLSEVK